MSGPTSGVESRYDVELVSVGTRPRRVAPIVASFTELSKREAWELLLRTPVFILEGAGYATAQGAKEALERAGATVEMQARDVQVPGPAPQTPTPISPGRIALLVVGIVITLAILALVLFALTFASTLDALRTESAYESVGKGDST